MGELGSSVMGIAGGTAGGRVEGEGRTGGRVGLGSLVAGGSLALAFVGMGNSVHTIHQILVLVDSVLDSEQEH